MLSDEKEEGKKCIIAKCRKDRLSISSKDLGYKFVYNYSLEENRYTLITFVLYHEYYLKEWNQ